MGTIGGLDVSYGAQLQIVRTNVLLIEVTTANVVEAGAANLLNLAQQGLPSMIAPDFIAFTDDADADIEDTGWDDASIFQDKRFVGTTETTFTCADNHGLLRDIRECPLAPGGVTPVASTTALGTEIGFTGGKFSIEAVLSVAAIELTTLDGATPAAVAIQPSMINLTRVNTAGSTDHAAATGAAAAGITAAGAAPITSGVLVDGPNDRAHSLLASDIQGAAMERAFENSQINASMATAGIPAGQVSHMDLSGIGEYIVAEFSGTGCNFAAGDLSTLNAGTVIMGQMDTTETTNLAWDDVDDELANNAAIISVVSLARVS